MTRELKEALDAEMDSAIESMDQERINVAQAHYNKAMSDCQFKTADRVKNIDSLIKPMSEDVKSIKSAIEGGKKKLMKIAFNAVKWIVIGGGGTEFVRYLMENWR